ncbi:unnamed protein product [Effrenium voratum]|uniref:Uncharacterized protein n=1 Tax=Effrenium voratum TaxID=2562239 RepID=A0AA36J1R1_9DINO|nr:unnamed protein product [Effrenium voratum]CAJ1434560.1 unnamed protein product [Effrenium voratum]
MSLEEATPSAVPVTHWKTYDFFEDQDELSSASTQETSSEEDEVTQVLTFDPFEPILAKPHVSRLVPFVVPAASPRMMRWRVEGRKLQTSEKQVLSPLFHVDPSFRIMILAKQTRGKHQQGFAKAKGFGRIFLKCQCSELVPRLQARVTVTGANMETRGPFRHDFNESSCCPLGELWDLTSLLDNNKSLDVEVELSPI